MFSRLITRDRLGLGPCVVQCKAATCARAKKYEEKHKIRPKSKARYVWFGFLAGSSRAAGQGARSWTPFRQALNQFPDGWMDDQIHRNRKSPRLEAKHRQSGAVKQALKCRSGWPRQCCEDIYIIFYIIYYIIFTKLYYTNQSK